MSSWFSPKTEKPASPIQGRGLFARDAISAGEIVAVKGGTIMGSTSFALVRDEVLPAEIQIGDGFYIAPAMPRRLKQTSVASTIPVTKTSVCGVRSRS